MLGCGRSPHPNMWRIPSVFTDILSRLLEA